jgi:phosphoglycolate phosphatase
VNAVIFDLDGVLVDSRAAISGAMNHALAANGFPQRTATDLYRFIGPPLALGFAELTAQPADSTAVVACVSAYRERYAASSLRETEVVPGIPEALEELEQQGHHLAVATSKAPVLAEPLLETLGLRKHFQAVAGPGLSAHAEDKATTIGAALHALGGPDRAVMVGDRSFDIAGARAHGIATVGVTWGIGSIDELTAAGADALVDAPAQLAYVVDALLTPARAPRAAGAATWGPGAGG